jgi:acyl-CoA thioesterase FadM
MQYRVLFHDTMAYGSHHHTANFKFQNIARETFMFDAKVGPGGWEEQSKGILLMTREAYSLNFSPVGLGQCVAILLTYEELSRSTVRLCFRVMNQEGQPVSCGYQTIIPLNKDTQEVMLAPMIVTQYLSAERESNLIEKLTAPPFAERLHAGGKSVREIFPESIRRLGKVIANAPRETAYPKIIDEALNEYAF